MFWWDKFVKCDMNFKDYGVMYPSVPKQPPENKYASVPFFRFLYENLCWLLYRFFFIFSPGASWD